MHNNLHNIVLKNQKLSTNPHVTFFADPQTT